MLPGNLSYSGMLGLLASAGRHRTALLCGLLAYAAGAWARTPGARVLVVYNANDSDSRRVASYYMAKRAIPKRNACPVRLPTRRGFDSRIAVPWDKFGVLVRNPVRKCLEAAGRDAILYIVLSYRTPYLLVQVPIGSGKALDSFVADVWDEAGTASPERNPYFAQSDARAGFYPAFLPLASYRREAGAKEIYSVWRLDGPSAAAAMGLVDRAIEAERSGLAGQVCIDRRAGETMSTIPNTGYGVGEWELHGAAELLRAAGLRVVEDGHEEEFGTPPAPTRCDDAVFYAGWYSLNHYNDAFTWAPGAIGIHLDSESAEDPRGGPNWAANALKRGITVTSGAVAEPYLPGLPHPDGIVHDLLAGASVGDALLRNTAVLKWMIINIGDPLYQPRFVPSR
jgi:uncharacterized protein (TIGR03790 family)